MSPASGVIEGLLEPSEERYQARSRRRGSSGKGAREMGDLRGQSALVMGALGTAGAAVAKTLAEAGASVMLSARRGKDGEESAAGLSAAGHRVAFVAADVTRRQDVVDAVERTVAAFGRIDILVNCFSLDHLRRFLEDSEEAWERMIAVNYKGVLYACHAALQHMVPQGYGRIVNLTSDSGKIGATLETVQSGTKAAVIAFSKSLAREVARHGVTVNALCLGVTQDFEGPRPGVSPAGFESFLRLVPFRRPAKPAEVAAVAGFLASPEASYVTGQAISASGGLTMC